jgi:hypothetical protein
MTVAGFNKALNADFRAMRSNDGPVEEGSIEIVVTVARYVLRRRCREIEKFN